MTFGYLCAWHSIDTCAHSLYGRAAHGRCQLMTRQSSEMKRCRTPFLLGLCAFLCCGWSIAQGAAPTDPVCGFVAGPHFYYEADQVKQGLTVELKASLAQDNSRATLRFFVRQKPRDFPVDRLQIEHEKFMHIIGVRDDLTGFFHLHPVRVAPGVWEVDHVFNSGGNYKIWSDLKYRGVSYSFGHPLLHIPGSTGQAEPTALLHPLASSGYQVDLKHSEPLECGRTNQFQFTIVDPLGKTPDLENVLGAPMHLVLVRDDLSVYLHAHPEPRGPGEHAIRFRQSFTKAGNYKLFAQVRPKDATLPADETILADFSIKVQPAGP
jgi:hypothetical protein